MSARRALPVGLLVACVPALLALLTGASPGEPRRVEVATSFSGRELRVTARILPDLPESVVRRLASGLPTSTSWEIALYAHRDLWPDGWKDARRYEVTATYRPGTGDFTVERRLDERLLETVVVPSREEALAALDRVSGLPCFVMQRHLDGKELVVKVRCAYATGVSMGVVPTTTETDRARSKTFVWNEPKSP